MLVGRNLVVTVHDGPPDRHRGVQGPARGRKRTRRARRGCLHDRVSSTRSSSPTSPRSTASSATSRRSTRSRSSCGAAAISWQQWSRCGTGSRSFAGRSTPNRDALSPIVRPDFEVHEDLVRAWPGTIDRLERAIDGVDKTRELLVGSFDIYLGRSAQRSNDVMKTLTLVSAIALPAIVLAGIMGMNFKLPFFDERDQFLGRRPGRWRHWQSPSSACPAGAAGSDGGPRAQSSSSMIRRENEKSAPAGPAATGPRSGHPSP